MASPRYTRNIRPEDLEQKTPAALSRKQKRENFWYYHKWHVLLGLLGILLAFMLVYSLSTVTSPDYQITLLSPYPRSATALEALQQQLSVFGKDRNADGKVVVQVQQYTVASTEELSNAINPQANMAGTAQLQGDAQTGGTVIFLTDDFEALQARYSFFTDLNAPYTGIDTMPQNGTYYIPWTACPPLCALDLGSVTALDGETVIEVADEFSDTVLCMRTITGTTLENDEQFRQYYADCLELFRAITGSPAGL